MGIIKHFIHKKIFNKQWRKLNKHNFTVAQNIFDPKVVSVGNYTYGNLNIKSWGSIDEGLNIGSFCSIADDVVFLLGGNHDYKNISSYPISRKLLNGKSEATTKGKIIIEDDVWIGYRSTILSGVVIGQGAIVAAGSVVTKNVSPYTIVGGNPAKIIKLRFNNETIDKLVNINLNNIDVEIIKKNYHLFNDSQINDEKITELIQLSNRSNE